MEKKTQNKTINQDGLDGGVEEEEREWEEEGEGLHEACGRAAAVRGAGVWQTDGRMDGRSAVLLLNPDDMIIEASRIWRPTYC